MTYGPGSCVYFYGSLRASHKHKYNVRLSDADFLVIPKCNSLEDYEKHLLQAINLRSALKNINSQVEVFLIGASIIKVRLHCLSVIVGDDSISNKDLIYGNPTWKDANPHILPSATCCKALYEDEARRFCDAFSPLLPNADTRQARKTAKSLLNGLKLIVCAHAEPPELKDTEERLFTVQSFEEIKKILASTNLDHLELDSILDHALSGKRINDWSKWVKIQDALAQWLISIRKAASLSHYYKYTRLLGGICEARNMLGLEIKNILSAKNELLYLEMVDSFTHNTARLVARLALSGGTTALADFKKYQAPPIVLQASEIVVKHLRLNRPTTRVLAASLVLLEYSFLQGIARASKVLE